MNTRETHLTFVEEYEAATTKREQARIATEAREYFRAQSASPGYEWSEDRVHAEFWATIARRALFAVRQARR